MLEKVFKYLFLISALIANIAYLYKDEWPEPGYYDLSQLESPLQTEANREPFSIDANNLRYTLNPKVDYELQGVAVSLSDAYGTFFPQFETRATRIRNL